jgi:hypothetical protein
LETLYTIANLFPYLASGNYPIFCRDGSRLYPNSIEK